MKKEEGKLGSKKYYLFLLVGVVGTAAVVLALRFNNGQGGKHIDLNGDEENNNNAIYYEKVADNYLIEDFYEEDKTNNMKSSELMPSEDDLWQNDAVESVKEFVPEEEELATVFSNASDSINDTVITSGIEIRRSELTFSEDSHIIMPVEGNPYIGYDSQNPAYFETLDYYRISQEMYIRPIEDKSVVAVYDGRIASIEKDSFYGTMITLNHGNQVFSIYGQVVANDEFKEGDFIKQGEKIGEITGPTKFFVKEGEHLYFKMMKNEDAINPMNYMN